MRVVQLASAGEPDVGELVKLINQDPALIAQILKTANSAFASRGVEIKTVRDAVVRLGATEVAAAAAASATSSVYKPEQGNPNAFPALRRRLGIEALAAALGGGFVALDLRGVPADEVFAGGLLHDIGKLFALDALGSSELTGKLEGFDPAIHVEALLEATHEELGAKVAEAWKLPAYLVELCRGHHTPPASPTPDRRLHAVRLAAAAVEIEVNPRHAPARLEELKSSGAVLGFDAFRLRALAAEVKGFAKKAEALLSTTLR
jgi:HD-like signal output (HDOD) protein